MSTLALRTLFLLALLFGTVGIVMVMNETREEGSDLEHLTNILLLDDQGSETSLGDFAGRALVVNSWAVWCPFCKKELPDLVQLQADFPEIVVIAIDRAETIEKTRAYTDELGISDRMTFFLDERDDFYQTIGGFSMPETIFIDASGDIVYHKRGPMTLEDMRAAVEEYLK